MSVYTEREGGKVYYVFDNFKYRRYCTIRGTKYVKCIVEACNGAGKLENDEFALTKSHSCRSKRTYDEPVSKYAKYDEPPRYRDGEPFDVTLKHPSTMVISGPTSCGKTRFVFRLLDNLQEMFSPAPRKVLYCYSEYQEIFDNYQWVQFHEGLPDLDTFHGTPTLLVLDDLMSETTDDVTKLFTKISHHRSVTVIYLTQNIFYQNKQNRTISLNSHYMVLFKSVRSTSQIAALAAQMYSKGSKYMIEAFNDATKDPHSYLLVDMRPETDEKLRLRTKIFPGEIQEVYVRK